MIFRTHLVITIFAILIFIPLVEHKIIFGIVALISSSIPDIDTYFSRVGKNKFARVLQFFTKHRGMIHSITFAIFISLIISFIFPILGLPFFLGYSLHIFADSFTIDGVQPFWPYKKESKGFVKTGKYSELAVFIIFLILDFILLIMILA